MALTLMLWGASAIAVGQGGYGIGTLNGTAEVYDPTTGQWDWTAEPIKERRSHSLVLLADGRVLAVGGAGNQEFALELAEIWDPTTESWSTTGDMSFARVDAAAALLSDGQVLISGGAGTTRCESTPLRRSITPPPASGPKSPRSPRLALGIPRRCSTTAGFWPPAAATRTGPS